MILFQFHKGTIKTPKLTAFLTAVFQFQFHKGTIKTVYHRLSTISESISIP